MRLFFFASVHFHERDKNLKTAKVIDLNPGNFADNTEPIAHLKAVHRPNSHTK